MSTIKSSAENLTLNADGANNDIKFQSNGSEVASIDQAGVVTASGVSLAAGGTLTTASGNDLNIVYPDSRSLFIKEAGTTHVTVDNTGKVGIGTATPQTEMHVVTANASLVHIGGTANANGDYQGISLGYAEAGNTSYRKVAIVSGGINDNSARQDFHVLVDIAADGNSVVLGDSKFKISGTTGICNASSGITFGTDTAAANALDDYEEGTWTPGFRGSTTAGNHTYHGRTGVYTKVGRAVHIEGQVHMNAINTMDGTIYVTGLPFTVGTSGSAFSFSYAGAMSLNAGTTPVGYSVASSTEFVIYAFDIAGGTTDINQSEMGNGTQVVFSGTYFI
jgi:hypothetical protein